MRSSILGLLLIVFMVPACDDSESSTPGERYSSLLKTHNLSRGVYANDREEAAAAAKPFFKLARSHPDDPAAVDALGWVATHCLFKPQAGEAMELLGRDHIKSERLGSVIHDIDEFHGDPFDPMEKLCRKAMEESPHRAVRGRACLALARKIKKAKENAERGFQEYALFLAGRKIPYAPKPESTQADLDRLTEESASLFERVVEEYGDVVESGVTLGDAAKSDLFELRGLTIGRTAPEIEGRDVDGKPFKLSDYRGKVVILTFSGNWCGPCRAAYPDQRELVERWKDEPFALLSVNTDREKETLRTSIKSGEITWRCWYDGGPDGPITTRWSIDGFPTVYVIDAAGVIRCKQPRFGDDLAADSLLKAMKAGAKP